MSSPEVPVQDQHAKALLLRAAKKLFGDKGLDGVSVREIAAAADVNVSLVSYHFGGKEGLYRACLEMFGQGRLQAVKGVLQTPRSIEEFRLRLDIFIDTIFDGFVAEPDVVRMVHRECEQELPVIEDIFRETFLKIFESLFKFIQYGKEAGFLKPEADPHITAALIHGSLVHMAKMDPLAKRYFGHSIHDPVYRKRLKDQILLLSLDGVCLRKV